MRKRSLNGIRIFEFVEVARPALTVLVFRKCCRGESSSLHLKHAEGNEADSAP